MRIPWKIVWKIILASGVIFLAVGIRQISLAPLFLPIGFSLLFIVAVTYGIDERIKREEEKQAIQANANPKEYYEEGIRTWKRSITAVIMGAPVILALCVLDIWYYGKTGKSVLHPYLDILIGLGALGLFVMAVIFRISYSLKQKNQLSKGGNLNG